MTRVVLWLLSGLLFSGLYLAWHFYGQLRHLRAKGASRWQLIKGVAWIMRPAPAMLPAYIIGIVFGPFGWFYFWACQRVSLKYGLGLSDSDK